MRLYEKVRLDLELSQIEMAKCLGLQGKSASQAVHELETGRRQPTGPIHRLYILLDAMLTIDPELAKSLARSQL